MPFWTNHNEQTTSWDPPPCIPSEAVDASQTSPKDTKYAETEDSSVEASSRPVSGSNFPRCFDANGRKLPEGEELLNSGGLAVFWEGLDIPLFIHRSDWTCGCVVFCRLGNADD